MEDVSLNVTGAGADDKVEKGRRQPLLPIGDTDANVFENIYVNKVYENIADHFSYTRYSPWPRVVTWLNNIDPFSVVADVGCGNGKYSNVNQSLQMIGCDRSVSLCNICVQKGFETVSADVIDLPFREGVFDALLSIAVIHHLSTKKRRIEALTNLSKLLRPEGIGLIYVWAMEQKRNNAKSKYLKKAAECSEESEAVEKESVTSGGGRELSVHVNRTQFKQQDILVPWKLRHDLVFSHTKTTDNEHVQKDNSCYNRYYHLFVEGELTELASCVPTIDIVDVYYDNGNWCLYFKKL